MSVKLKYSYDNFPSWAMSALINGDDSSFDDVDSFDFELFLYRHSDAIVWDYDSDSLDNPSFNSYPLFGAPCDVVRVEGYVQLGVAS